MSLEEEEGLKMRSLEVRLLELDRKLSTLRTAMEDFKADKRLLLLQPYQHLFEQFWREVRKGHGGRSERRKFETAHFVSATVPNAIRRE